LFFVRHAGGLAGTGRCQLWLGASVTRLSVVVAGFVQGLDPAPFDSAGGATYHARAMANRLFTRRSPTQLADSAELIEYKGVLSEFKRLAAVVEADLNAAAVSAETDKWRELPVATTLRFSWLDPQHECVVTDGSAEAELELTCQRCLQPMLVRVNATLNFVLTGSDAGEKLPEVEIAGDGLERWELDVENWRTADIVPAGIVEEALIMAMPFAPLHDTDECRELTPIDARVENTTSRPFADLKRQLEKT